MGVAPLCILFLFHIIGVTSWILDSPWIRGQAPYSSYLAAAAQAPSCSIHDQLLDAYATIGIPEYKHIQAPTSIPLSIILPVFRDYYRLNMISEAVQALKIDFGIDDAIDAHCLRAALWQLYRENEAPITSFSDSQGTALQVNMENNTLRSNDASPYLSSQTSAVLDLLSPNKINNRNNNQTVNEKLQTPRKLYKEVTLTNTISRNRTYSDNPLPPALKAELEHDYYEEFLIKPTPEAPTPLRAATAKTYLRHAKLFVQWYAATSDSVTNTTRLSDILNASGDEASVQCFWDFCAYLRTERAIAKSYEANLWRGLGKLLKYRHGAEVPAIRLIRRWHREAQQAARKAPRSSNEDRKWLSWPQYLTVVQTCRAEYEALLEEATKKGEDIALDRKVAISLQRYLVLAVFATVPDRQRTIRELEIGSTLCQVNGIWCIRHTSQKYKTGKTYGERPLLQLEPISADIDAFLNHWRSKLLCENQHNFLFLQVRTGRPLTQDSVYQLVGRACYEHTGQRTNPHLLRDMIVTHVRQSNQASEQELEALGTSLDQRLYLCIDSPLKLSSTVDGAQYRRTKILL